MQISQQLVQNFIKKTFRKSETSDCLFNWETRHNAEPSQCITEFTTNDKQFYNDLQPFACIMTKRFDSTQKINLAIISGKRIKKNVEKRQHKIKQTNYWPVFNETIKVEEKQKLIELSWNLTFTKLFCNRDSTRFTSKYEFKHFKDIKIYQI